MSNVKSAAWWRAYRQRRKAREAAALVQPRATPAASVHAACDLRIAELTRERDQLREALAMRDLFDG